MRPNVVIERLKGLATGRLHHYAFQRIFRDQPVREWIANRVAKARPSASADRLTDVEIGEVKRLANDGFISLPGLITTEQIFEIKEYLRDKLCYNRNRPLQGDRFLPDQPPLGTHVAAYSDADTVNCPHVLQLANDERVLRLVGGYFKCRPTISNLSLWWSLKTDEAPEEAENFHRDIDDWRQLKLFIYLTDVDDDLGPHVFVRESHRIRQSLDTRRYSDEEVISGFGAGRIVTFTGPMGTCFLENTFGLHKGKTARGGNRLLLQVLYTLNPLGVSEYNPIDRADATAVVDRYINRLYIL